MYPHHHAITSATGTAIIAVLADVSGALFGVWVVLGTIAGVLIDVDHVILAMVIKGRWKEGIHRFRHPITAITEPDRLLADIDYPRLPFHRLITHLIILLAVMLASPLYPLLEPVAAGIGVHTASDVTWDLYTMER